MAFPTSPTNGQTATINGIQYTYSSATNSWTKSASTIINTVYNQANTGTVLAQAGFNQANTGLVLAQASFNNSNNKLNLSGGSLTGTLNTNSTINVTGNVMVETGYVSANNGVINVIQDSMGFVPYQPGLVWRRYNHTSASNITSADITAAIANGTFISQGVTSQVNNFTASGENYIIEFSGYFYANTTGIFTFSLDSDDGSDLFIDGYRVADWYGAHSGGGPGAGNYRSMYLKQGYHRLYARLIEFSGGDFITIYYQSPVTPAWTVIPGFLLDYDPTDLVRSDSSNAFTTNAIVSFSNTQAATSNTTGALRVSGGISSSNGGFWVSNTSVISTSSGTNYLEMIDAGNMRFAFARDVGSGAYINSGAGIFGINAMFNFGAGQYLDFKNNGLSGLRIYNTSGGNHVNYFSIYPTITGSSPILSATGSDSNLDLTLQPKGSGTVYTTSRLNVSNSLPSLIQSISSPNTELILSQTGDAFGSTTLRLQNRNLLNGALFENNTLGLVDFGFKNTTAQRNIRLESRGGYKLLPAGDGTEFQIGDPNSPSFVIGSTGVLVNKTTTSTNTSTGALIVNGGAGIAGNVTAAAVVVSGVELYNFSTAAFNQANTGTVLAQAAFNSANNVSPQIQPAFNQANTGVTLAQAAYNQANTDTVLTQAGYNQANTGTVLAQSAFNAANNASPSVFLANTILIANSQGYTANSNLQYISSNNTLITTGNIVANSITILSLRELKISMAANNIDLLRSTFFSKTITAPTIFTVTNVPPTNIGQTFVLDLTNGGSNTITWMTNTRWASGVAPTLSTSGRDVLVFFTYDAGSTWNGFLAARNML